MYHHALYFRRAHSSVRTHVSPPIATACAISRAASKERVTQYEIRRREYCAYPGKIDTSRVSERLLYPSAGRVVRAHSLRIRACDSVRIVVDLFSGIGASKGDVALHTPCCPKTFSLARTAQIGHAWRWPLKACRSFAQGLDHEGTRDATGTEVSGDPQERAMPKPPRCLKSGTFSYFYKNKSARSAPLHAHAVYPTGPCPVYV